ncbi:sensor histidine kinase [Actomonas aquatica]|uniref:histidine kinase n=1 Tax=Actomonas aquatica TaxID=2866162 RepID=A0ABZ1CEE6_9BACT|nr:ATP-binding protein [Opitutus sp. WL0086]WRQ90040.1 ATP-binding protein [Opitutus sp. WL0086]
MILAATKVLLPGALDYDAKALSSLYFGVAVVCLIMAMVLVKSNPRQSFNWAAGLILGWCGLWQFDLGLMYLHPLSAGIYIRGAMGGPGIAWVLVLLLLRSLVEPERSLRSHLRQLRWYGVTGGVFFAMAFSPWVIPYESTYLRPLRGMLWVPFGLLQILGGLHLGIATLRTTLRLRGSWRYVANLICGVGGVILLLVGARTILRYYLPTGSMVLSNAVIGVTIAGVFGFATLTRRVFRARAVLMTGLYYLGGLAGAIGAAGVVFKWVGTWVVPSLVPQASAVAAAMLVWAGLEWRRRHTAERRRLAAVQRVIQRLSSKQVTESGAASIHHWLLEELQDEARVGEGHLLVRQGDRWVGQEVSLRWDDPLLQVLESSECWITRHALARMWQRPAVEGAKGTLVRLGGEVAVRSSVDGVGPAVLLILGPKTNGEVFSAQEVSNLVALVEAVSGAAESAEAGRRGRLLGRVEALQMLAASIGHDFKQHLMAVRMLARRLADRSLTADVAEERLRQINRELDEMGAFSRRLTQLAQKQDVGPKESILLTEVVRTVVAELAPEASAAHVSLTVSIAHPDVRTVMNRGRLEKALAHMGWNAIRAMADTADVGSASMGGRAVEFEVRRRGQDGVIAVSDSGPGLPRKVEMRLFDPFVARAATSGGGLGLYEAWDAVTRAGGSMRYEHNHPHGAKFLLFLPGTDAGGETGAR